MSLSEIESKHLTIEPIVKIFLEIKSRIVNWSCINNISTEWQKTSYVVFSLNQGYKISRFKNIFLFFEKKKEKQLVCEIRVPENKIKVLEEIYSKYEDNKNVKLWLDKDNNRFGISIYVEITQDISQSVNFVVTLFLSAIQLLKIDNEILGSFNQIEKLEEFEIDIANKDSEEEKIYYKYEGATKTLTSKVYERVPKLRKACIEYYTTEDGIKCEICGFDFQNKYGEAGEEIIDIHHKKPLNEINEVHLVNPIEDLIPVCSNCHRVIHSKRPAYSVDEVKAMIAHFKTK